MISGGGPHGNMAVWLPSREIDLQGEVQWTRVLSLEGINHTLTGDLATDGGSCFAGF